MSLYELTREKGSLREPNIVPERFIEERISGTRHYQNEMMQLLQYSGFPEPFLSGKNTFHTRWQNSYIDVLVKEDLREITKIQELENVATLISFLPERIGSPLSINSLKVDIGVSYNAVKNYLKALELSYVLFFIYPYTKNIKRSVLKEPKIYFFDWTRATDNAKIFENYKALN